MADTAVAPDSSAPVIEARGLYKAFGSNVLLENATLKVERGETVALIGESGSGKSVLLKMFIGLIEPDQGQILFAGQDLATLDQPQLDEVRRKVGYVFQNDALFDSMTILDNVSYGLREHTKQSDEEIRERVTDCLRRVGLAEHNLDLYPAVLSGGMRKRVGLARAIASRPEVLMYDEPTQGLDPVNITRIAELIDQLRFELGATSIIVTHDMRTAFYTADRIALLHDGHFPYIGTPVELLRSEEPAVCEFIDEARHELEGVELAHHHHHPSVDPSHDDRARVD